MIAGMDFGTTNSGMAVYDGQAVRLLPLDAEGANPRVLRTALYLTRDQGVHIGRGAVDRYYAHNIDRPVKLQRVWVGEMEVYGADMYYVTDVYAWVDVLAPGRLFLSIKSSLRDADYHGTVVGQFYYALEDLVAVYLTAVRVRAERLLGQPLRQVVLGRPVRFAREPEHDRLAQARLLRAAFRAGYETVYFQTEPVAAAFSYELSLDRPQHVLVFDFGGGTLDITIMRLGEPGRRRVLASGGIPVAGDVFDQKLVRAKLPPHFGEGSVYGPRHESRPVPRWIFDAFSDWQKMLELQTAENRQILAEIAHTSRRRYQIEALIRLVSSNYSLRMFDVVEQAKRRLSSRRGAEIRLEGSGFKVLDFVTRSEFEQIIRAEIEAIDQHLDEVVQQSGLRPGDIDAVIRTGGSAQIPAFYRLLGRKFGPERVHSIDTFSSVTAGLGIVAHQVAAGTLSLPGYTPDDVARPAPAEGQRPHVAPINLDVMHRRIRLAEERAAAPVTDAGDTDARVLVCLDGQGRVTAVPLPDAWRRAEPLALDGPWPPAPPVQAIAAAPDEQLLLLTTAYRFLLFTPRRLLDMQQARLAISDQYPLAAREQVCSLNHWDRLRHGQRLLLVTSLGVARPYPLNVMRDNVETPVPLRFDQPLPGVVVAALHQEEADALVVMTRRGRGVRIPAPALRFSGVQAINVADGDRLVAAAAAPETAELLVVTADGHGRRLPARSVPPAPRPNSKGRSLVARRSDVVGLAAVDPAHPVWLVTGAGLHPVAAADLPLADSTRTFPVPGLAPGERVTAMCR